MHDDHDDSGDDTGLRFHGGNDALSGDSEMNSSGRIPSAPHRRLDLIWLPKPKTVCNNLCSKSVDMEVRINSLK